MKIKINHIVSVFFFILFIGCYFLPFYTFNNEQLLGYELYIFNLAGYVFVENLYDYILLLLDVLVIMWVALLFMWSFKNKVHHFLIVSIVSILAIFSSFHWYFQIENTEGVAFGYWLWVISVFMISFHALFISIRVYVIKKKNAATKE